MNPYQSPIESGHGEQPSFVIGVVSVFCFGWSFGTATRGQLDAFGWLGVVVLVIAIFLWRASGSKVTW